jgi:hypothetical protein
MQSNRSVAGRPASATEMEIPQIRDISKYLQNEQLQKYM